jgi:hypothetical protein
MEAGCCDSPSRAHFYSPQIHYISGVFDIKARHEEVDVIRCLHLQGMVPGHLFV